MSNNRLIQFDILKGIGIICVLLGHTDVDDIVAVQIYAFHMPLFFFVAVCFLEIDHLGKHLRRV